MYRVTRKQMVRQDGNVIEFEDSCDFDSERDADSLRHRLLLNEIQVGCFLYGPDKVIFETPSFYRSVTVTIEEIK